MAEDQARRVRIWDPALRAFHWLLAVLVIANWLLGQFGPNIMTLHFWLGYTIVALLVFRLIWGFVGPESARFSSLFHGPRAVTSYLRDMGKRQPSHWPGHNPLGALAVIAMLLTLFWQVGTGLIADPEDFVNVGPLASKVGSDVATKADAWHALGANIILVLVLLHIVAILFYRIWKNEDLIRPMLTGWKWVRRR
ncbi:cytochrome b/b6 domain-containing protein [Paracoccus saliphilus]|uniref:Cytochrome b n=1 Tax=Paracoccus saliphilus TaxID=405559 RepID=A0AA45W5H3_9RHOB|nr:cytochrome b/b6 domain-containing protein [Paracoccus saliphilus]WCR02318.1 cytochrome b/b6 domain-containing protein [Paracoccus saliphilus]SIS93472.1 Cytochrome b [Paracoccus saliphilus]